MTRRGAVASLAAASLLLAGCTAMPWTPRAAGTAAGDAPARNQAAPTDLASPSDTASSRPPPDSWSGIHVEGDRVTIVRDGRRIAMERAEAGLQPELTYTDADHGDPVLWSTCCEPVLGSTHARNGFDGYGARVDRVGDDLVRVGADGTVFVGNPANEQVAAFEGIVDATIVGERILALRDFEQVPNPETDTQLEGLTLVHVSRQADVTAVATLRRPACALTRYGPDAVVVLHPGGGGPAGPLYCRGTRLSVLDATSGAVRDRIVLDEEIVHLSSDDTGGWLIVTRRSGAVDGIGVDGTTGRLAESGYLRADW